MNPMDLVAAMGSAMEASAWSTLSIAGRVIGIVGAIQMGWWIGDKTYDLIYGAKATAIPAVAGQVVYNAQEEVWIVRANGTGWTQTCGPTTPANFWVDDYIFGPFTQCSGLVFAAGPQATTIGEYPKPWVWGVNRTVDTGPIVELWTRNPGSTRTWSDAAAWPMPQDDRPMIAPVPEAWPVSQGQVLGGKSFGIPIANPALRARIGASGKVRVDAIARVLPQRFPYNDVKGAVRVQMESVKKFMEFTELRDFLDAMWDALPKQCKTKARGSRIPVAKRKKKGTIRPQPRTQVSDIYNCFSNGTIGNMPASHVYEKELGEKAPTFMWIRFPGGIEIPVPSVKHWIDVLAQSPEYGAAHNMNSFEEYFGRALDNLIKNQIEDFVYGKIGKVTAGASKSFGELTGFPGGWQTIAKSLGKKLPG